MASSNPYIGCRIRLLSKAQNRYEGILYTIDKNHSTVVLSKVKCFGTEGRPTERPTPPKDDVYEYITFRGSDIKDIALCESPRSDGLPPDPAIIQSFSSSSGIYSSLGLFSPIRKPAYNHLATSSLLSQQYAAALGLDLHFRRGPMVEKAVQTIQVEKQRRGLTASQKRQWNRRRPPRTRRVNSQPQRDPATRSSGSGVTSNQPDTQQQNTDHPLARRRQAPRHQSSGRGRLMVANIPSPILKFDTDFDFASSNAQFIKDELEREVQEKRNLKDEGMKKAKARMHTLLEYEDIGPECYYDKAKSFFDNVSSDNGLGFRLTWAEERKRNLETFGVTGRFVRGQGFRGRFTGRRGRGAAQILSLDRFQRGRV
ncbi:protein LSM14 homolog B [Poeciliopsis prolifica]|uniref:protein LSM14 homolog B n=1 Tax=Poeciliopsis prolifica TaxID=188132 RepID=UPI0024130DF9|nr:protein LSM14 homolog B [Poeciliopsis prolifica]